MNRSKTALKALLAVAALGIPVGLAMPAQAMPSFQDVRRSACSQWCVKCAAAQTRSRLNSPCFGRSLPIGLETGHA